MISDLQRLPVLKITDRGWIVARDSATPRPVTEYLTHEDPTCWSPSVDDALANTDQDKALALLDRVLAAD